jgi:hypothetical protein
MYGQYVKRDAIYAAGNRQPIDPSLDSTVGIARLLHVVKLSERWTVDPQFLLPFGELRTGGDVSALGNARGVGDLILATAFKYKIDEKEQSDKQKTDYVHASAGYFVTPGTQILAAVGRDIRQENGFRENFRLNLRLLTIF